jgi:anti-sigma regulatory factor (Ser/Thr protein kinase)
VELDIKLPCVDRSAYSARRCMDALAPFLDPVRADELRLLVSELVTNSILHAGGDARSWIHLIVKIIPNRRVRAEVHDYGPGFTPAVPDQVDDADLVHGRGLFLVEHLADAWSVEKAGRTKVWFEIDLKS